MAFELFEKTDVIKHVEQLDGSILLMHGCNAQGVMGSGVARALRTAYPAIFRFYERQCLEVPTPLLLGSVVPVDVTDYLTIVNAITQEYYGRRSMPGHSYAKLEFIEAALFEISKLDRVYDHYVTVPVGCGLGGLSWESTDMQPRGVSELFESSSFPWQVCRL